MLDACRLLVAGAQDAWSGEVIFDVTPRQATESQWDYLPQTVTYETNGEAWRILEQGTSFERVWIGSMARPPTTSCSISSAMPWNSRNAAQANPSRNSNGDRPHAHGTLMLEVLLFVNDGPVRYELKEQSKRAVKCSNWDRKHFELPNGYEPIDKPGLAALLQSLGRPLD